MNTAFGYVFPGQGSQSVGMLDHFQQFPAVNDTLNQASQILNYDLAKLIAEGPASELDQTVYTQPALLATEVAIYRVICGKKPAKAALLAGHSLGEYSALVAAESILFQDAIRMVALRGEYMQEAVPPGVGAMAALIGLENDVVKTVCEEAIESDNDVLSPANYNTIGQVVISGHKTAVERALVIAKKHGAKLAMMIPVSVPSHCALMKPAAIKLKTQLEKIEIQPPVLTVINNADVKPYQNRADIIDGLMRQLYNPVRWVETMQYFAEKNVMRVVECGPGKILTGLNKRISNQFILDNTATMNQFQTWIEAE